MNARNIAAIIMVSTVCAVILSMFIGALFYPPGTVTETFRVKMTDLLTYILGVVSGWLLNREPQKPTT